MANKVISMQLIRTLIQLLEKEYSLRFISSQLKLSRQTITLYANRLNNAVQSLEELRQLPDADA
jgi:Trp operon repressor